MNVSLHTVSNVTCVDNRTSFVSHASVEALANLQWDARASCSDISVSKPTKHVESPMQVLRESAYSQATYHSWLHHRNGTAFSGEERSVGLFTRWNAGNGSERERLSRRENPMLGKVYAYNPCPCTVLTTVLSG